MGQKLTTCQDTNKENRSVVEQLGFLVNVCKSKLDKYQTDMTDQYLNTGREKKEVVGGRALRWQRGYRVGVSYEDPLFIADVEDSIDLYFSSGLVVHGDEGRTILHGLKKHVIKSLRWFFEYTLAGELEEEKFFVFVQHNSIIRIDCKFWRYNFNSSRVMAKAQNAFAYLFCVSVVDHTKLSVDELTFLLSQYAGDFYVAAYAKYLIEVWKQIYQLKWEVDRLQHELSLLDLSKQEKVRGLLPTPPSSHGDDEEEREDEREDSPLVLTTQRCVPIWC